MYVDAQERRSIYEVGRATAALMMISRITTRQIASLRHGVTSLECYICRWLAFSSAFSPLFSVSSFIF